MYAFLRGAVSSKLPDLIHLDVNGVGFEVRVPDGVQRRLTVGQEVTLLTYCHIREDAFTIFGFLREDEKSLFLTLLGLNKVGPKLALAILSAMPLSEFARAVQNSDVAAFQRVPGVGKTTAQRVVLDLKTKLKQDPDLAAILGEDGQANDEPADDVIAALLSLGCTPQEAKKAAAGARERTGEDASDEEVVRVALRSLARI